MVFTVCFTVVETKLEMHMNNIQAAPKKQSQFKVLVVVGAGQALNKLTKLFSNFYKCQKNTLPYTPDEKTKTNHS